VSIPETQIAKFGDDRAKPARDRAPKNALSGNVNAPGPPVEPLGEGDRIRGLRDTAGILGISLSTLRRMISAGSAPMIVRLSETARWRPRMRHQEVARRPAREPGRLILSSPIKCPTQRGNARRAKRNTVDPVAKGANERKPKPRPRCQETVLEDEVRPWCTKSSS
jgi:hypothetical protein